MNRYIFVVISFTVLVLSLSVAVGQEAPAGEQGAASVKDTSDSRKGVETGKEGKSGVGEPPKASGKGVRHPIAGKRDFLRLAEPKKKKKKPKVRPYGGYWMSTYGGKTLEEDSDEHVEEYVRPYFSPYAATLPEPEEPERPHLSSIEPPPLSEFIDVDFARFASGSYVSEYADKFVKMRCKFASLAPEGMRLKEFPAPDYINFLVKGTGSTMFSLTVAAPRDRAGRVFGLESQKEIILYGRAVKLGLSGLTLLVEEVETK